MLRGRSSFSAILIIAIVLLSLTVPGFAQEPDPLSPAGRRKR